MGAYNFASTTSNPLDSGNGYANALLGNYQTYQQATNRYIPKSYQYTLDFYVQDSWRVSKRLTVEMGLRFDHMGAPFDHTDTSSNFFPNLYSAVERGRALPPRLQGRPFGYRDLFYGKPRRREPSEQHPDVLCARREPSCRAPAIS